MAGTKPAIRTFAEKRHSRASCVCHPHDFTALGQAATSSCGRRIIAPGRTRDEPVVIKQFPRRIVAARVADRDGRVMSVSFDTAERVEYSFRPTTSIGIDRPSDASSAAS